ncbi:MAG TPA: Mrp/NBP35 family ATP-binding protein [Methylocystis sp.]|nr:Mrp/NBP35 family ATP-binding protein [Methylocystis sp.]
MTTEADILAALRNVKTPSGAPLTVDGAVSGLTLSGSKVFVSITGDPAHGAAWESVRQAAVEAIERTPGVERAIVTLTAERGPAPAAKSAAVGGAPAPAALEHVRFIVAVGSGKGGVGKSTTAANLALGLAAQNWRVGLLDADIYGPSAPRLLGISGKPQVEGGKLVPMEAHGVKVMSIGFLIDEETPMIWRGPMVAQALTQLLGEVVWGELDALVVDMPPGTGDVQLTLSQKVPLSGAIIVSTPQDLALVDARRAIAMFRKVNAPVLGVIENMSYFLCPHCGERTDIFSHGGARRDAERLGAPFLGEIPLDAVIRETADEGRPVVSSAPQGPHAAIYLGLAAKVKALLERQGRNAPTPLSAP